MRSPDIKVRLELIGSIYPCIALTLDVVTLFFLISQIDTFARPISSFLPFYPLVRILPKSTSDRCLEGCSPRIQSSTSESLEYLSAIYPAGGPSSRVVSRLAGAARKAGQRLQRYRRPRRICSGGGSKQIKKLIRGVSRLVVGSSRHVGAVRPSGQGLQHYWRLLQRSDEPIR